MGTLYDALGITEYGATGDHLYGVRITFAATFANAEGGEAEALMVKAACQELGHALGLDHSPNVTSCMNNDLVGYATGSAPDGHDYAELQLIYSHAT